MDIVAIERDLTAYFAGKFDLTVDQNIFRGSIPAGKSGVAVIVDSTVKTEIPFLPLQYNVQLLGTFNDRDEAMRFLTKAWNLFPVSDEKLSSCKVLRISTRGSGSVFSGKADIFGKVSNNGAAIAKSASSGHMAYFASINLFAVILTTGGQV